MRTRIEAIDPTPNLHILIAQDAPSPYEWKGHTYASRIYTMSSRLPQPSSVSHFEIFQVSIEQKKTSVHVFLIKIGQAIDFYLAGDSSLAIHGKTTAKVIKRIGICKKIGKFLANPNRIVDDLLLKQIRMGSRIK